MSIQPSGINLNTKPSIWMFLYRLMPLVVQINGQKVKATWGEQFIALQPGQHRISVAWKMYWVIPVNRGTFDVTIAPGEIVPVRYKVRWLWMLSGKLFAQPVPAPSVQAA